MYKFKHPSSAAHVFLSEKLIRIPQGMKPTSRSLLWVSFENWAQDFCEYSHLFNKKAMFSAFQRVIGVAVTGSDGRPAYRVLVAPLRKALSSADLAGFMEEDAECLADDAARLVEQVQTVEDPITGETATRAETIAKIRALLDLL